LGAFPYPILMTGKRDYYEVLGVSRSASPDEIRNAFRALAKQYHPDVAEESGTEERFKEINEAYAVLSDAERKAAYDRFGHEGLRGMNFDFDFGGFSDIFEGLFNFGMGGHAKLRGSRFRHRKGNFFLQTSCMFDLSGIRRRTRHFARPLHNL